MLDSAAVLYSGGVDSTVTASHAAEEARKVFLLTGVSMAHHRIDPRDGTPGHMRARLDSLRQVHPETEFAHVVVDARALHRHMWWRSRWEILEVGLWANLPCATCNPAIFARALVFCLEHGIGHLYGGHNVMMSCYPYQHPRCVELVGELASSFGVELRLPVYWRENEDVMMLYRSDEWSGDDGIQGSIEWGRSTGEEARRLGLVKEEAKVDFDEKNRTQMVCMQDCFVNYAMLLHFLPRLGMGEMTRRMLGHLELQAGTIRGLVRGYLTRGARAGLFRDGAVPGEDR